MKINYLIGPIKIKVSLYRRLTRYYSTRFITGN
jgi:hypothetical protein